MITSVQNFVMNVIKSPTYSAKNLEYESRLFSILKRRDTFDIVENEDLGTAQTDIILYAPQSYASAFKIVETCLLACRGKGLTRKTGNVKCVRVIRMGCR